MELNRRLFQADTGGPSYLPLDDHWRMAGEFAAPEVRESILLASAYMTPQEVEQLLGKSTLFQPSDTAIQNMVNEVGGFVEAHQELLNGRIHQEEVLPPATEVLVASMDGVNVLLREPGVKKGRPQQRLGKPDTTPKSSYKNAMVASFSYYQIEPKEEGLRPRRLQATYFSWMPEENYPTFKAQFEQELAFAESRLPTEAKKISLNDGHLSIWGYLEEQEGFEAYEKLIDFYHTTEHLASAAEALFGKNKQTADPWYHKWYQKLLKDEQAPQQLLRSLEYYQRKQKLPQSRVELLEKQKTFFQRNQKYMSYAAFRKKGWPIGSGPVEAACKSVVKTRLCRSGMRWSRKGGQHILHLRNYGSLGFSVISKGLII